MADGDDPDFNPRLHWAKENAEDLSLILIEKNKYDADMLLLKFFEQGPKKLKDIQNHFDWDACKARRHLESLRARQVKFFAIRDKGDRQLLYSVASRPKMIKFLLSKRLGPNANY